MSRPPDINQQIIVAVPFKPGCAPWLRHADVVCNREGYIVVVSYEQIAIHKIMNDVTRCVPTPRIPVSMPDKNQHPFEWLSPVSGDENR